MPRDGDAQQSRETRASMIQEDLGLLVQTKRRQAQQLQPQSGTGLAEVTKELRESHGECRDGNDASSMAQQRQAG
jgi:hypothetical protein